MGEGGVNFKATLVKGSFSVCDTMRKKGAGIALLKISRCEESYGKAKQEGIWGTKINWREGGFNAKKLSRSNESVRSGGFQTDKRC